jgi:hypothetical protein
VGHGPRRPRILVRVAQKPVPVPAEPTFTRPERVLAYMVASIIGLSILAIVAILIGYGTGVNKGGGIWQAVDLLPGIGLPIGFVLIIVLLVLNAVRRTRAAKGAGK